LRSNTKFQASPTFILGLHPCASAGVIARHKVPRECQSVLTGTSTEYKFPCTSWQKTRFWTWFILVQTNLHITCV